MDFKVQSLVLIWISTRFMLEILGNKYCKLNTCADPANHIFCLYPKKGVSKSCHFNSKITMDKDARIALLDLHNNFRNLWAEGNYHTNVSFPRAGDMLIMHWDYELEALAQRQLENCLNDLHCRNVERFEVGKNEYISYSAGEPDGFEVFFKNWILQHISFNEEYIKTYQYEDNIDFVQCIWAKSRALGCSISTYFDRKEQAFGRHLICNYGPKGANVDSKVYTAGDPCTNCPDWTKCGFDYQYPSLCGGANPQDGPYKIETFVVNKGSSYGDVIPVVSIFTIIEASKTLLGTFKTLKFESHQRK